MANAVSSSSVKTVVSAGASSPFAELLRRSRFASFDPYVRQTYVATQSHAQRGNYGLKRNINLKQKNSAISLKSFDERAAYTNWTPAESNARFIRQFDELHVSPQPAQNRTWANYIGTTNQLHWLIDSEASPGEGLTYEAAPPQPRYGKGGKYGGSRPTPNAIEHASLAVPNLTAMKPRQFRTFINRLRDARPEFREYMDELADAPRERYDVLSKKRAAGERLTANEVDFLDRYRDFAQQPLLSLAQNPSADHRARFLGERTRAEFADSTQHKIEQQPHRVGGLNYAHPTPIETLAYTRPRPGFVLQPSTSKQMQRAEEGAAANFVAGFAGMTALLRSSNAEGKKPLLRQTSRYDRTLTPVLDREHLAESMALMRVVPQMVSLSRPPRVVGKTTEELDMVDLQATVTANVDPARNFRNGNTFTPASPSYVAARSDADMQAELAARAATIEFHSLKAEVPAQRKTDQAVTRGPNPLIPRAVAKQDLTADQWLELAEALSEADSPLDRLLILLGEEGAARAMDRAAVPLQTELANVPVDAEVEEPVVEMEQLKEEELQEADGAEEATELAADALSPEFAATLAQAMLAELAEMYTPALVGAVLEGKETGAQLLESMRALVEAGPVQPAGDAVSMEKVKGKMARFISREREAGQLVQDAFSLRDADERVKGRFWTPPSAARGAGAAATPAAGRGRSNTWTDSLSAPQASAKDMQQERASVLSALDKILSQVTHRSRR